MITLIPGSEWKTAKKHNDVSWLVRQRNIPVWIYIHIRRSVKKMNKNMGVLLLLLFTVPFMNSSIQPNCKVPSESKQRVNFPKVCQSGCEDGWYGDHCRQTCHKFCVKCDRLTGNCSGHCKDGYFGDDCFNPCSHCSAGCDAKGKCSKTTTPTPSANINCNLTSISSDNSTKCDNSSNKFGIGIVTGIVYGIVIGICIGIRLEWSKSFIIRCLRNNEGQAPNKQRGDSAQKEESGSPAENKNRQ